MDLGKVAVKNVSDAGKAVGSILLERTRYQPPKKPHKNDT